MSSILQVMIGIGVGVLAFFLLRPRPIGYGGQKTNKSDSDYFSEPGERCAICHDTLDSRSMQYLTCGHALHDNCYEELKKRSQLCPLCRSKI